ncbi:MAG: hypothetical protein QOH60_3424 [Mycobacterium sp.]|jgi:hypothetical protein|nr:hypothetical protein [Mycobacterium sp.]
MSVATLLQTVCSGFLLAVLWMDLIFDSQVVGHRHVTALPEPVLGAIAGYYRRATTTSRPMSFLISVVMVTLLGALAFRAASGQDPAWLLAAFFALAGAPILLALARTVRNAVRLGTREDTPEDQSRLARMVFTDHVACFGLMLGFVVLLISTS